MESAIAPTLRQHVAFVLGLQGRPVTAAAIGEVLGVADHNQVARALRQLEADGQARRERGTGQQYGGGRVADRWTAS